MPASKKKAKSVYMLLCNGKPAVANSRDNSISYAPRGAKMEELIFTTLDAVKYRIFAATIYDSQHKELRGDKFTYGYLRIRTTQ